MRRLATALFAVVAYAAFLGAFGYFIGFTNNAFVPLTIDRGRALSSPLVAAAIDLALVLCFGVAHSVMARRSFKQAWRRLVPDAAERSVYVLVASAQFALLCWQWRPLPAPALWSTSGPAAIALHALAGLGWATVLLSSFLIDHLELFGLRQGFSAAPAVAAPPPTLRTPLLYRWMRHPLYFGILVALWATPTMSLGHLLLAAGMTAYILVGVRFEERDLLRIFGDEYRRYRARVSMLLPLPPRRDT